MSLGKMSLATACVLCLGSLTTQASASSWKWQHPIFYQHDGELNVSIETKLAKDWAYGDWKAECSGKAATGVDPVGTRVLQGISADTDFNYAHAVLCTNSDERNGKGWTVNKFNYVVLDILNKDDQRGSWQQYGDWSYGDFKGECPDGYAVTGIAQSANKYHDITKVLCSKINVSHPTSCMTVSVGDKDRWGWSVGYLYADYTYNTADWDYGYYKASCAADHYVAGVSAFGWDGSFHNTPVRLLCCK